MNKADLVKAIKEFMSENGINYGDTVDYLLTTLQNEEELEDCKEVHTWNYPANLSIKQAVLYFTKNIQDRYQRTVTRDYEEYDEVQHTYKGDWSLGSGEDITLYIDIHSSTDSCTDSEGVTTIYSAWKCKARSYDQYKLKDLTSITHIPKGEE
jgi:hypothetical protein